MNLLRRSYSTCIVSGRVSIQMYLLRESYPDIPIIGNHLSLYRTPRTTWAYVEINRGTVRWIGSSDNPGETLLYHVWGERRQ